MCSDIPCVNREAFLELKLFYAKWLTEYKNDYKSFVHAERAISKLFWEKPFKISKQINIYYMDRRIIYTFDKQQSVNNRLKEGFVQDAKVRKL